jgi:hypothetical protein
MCEAMHVIDIGRSLESLNNVTYFDIQYPT